jgi:hypothetical protein
MHATLPTHLKLIYYIVLFGELYKYAGNKVNAYNF